MFVSGFLSSANPLLVHTEDRVTDCSGHMGYTRRPNGFRGCRVVCSRSVYPRSSSMKETSHMASSTAFMRLPVPVGARAMSPL
jgi:hypothetical protein